MQLMGIGLDVIAVERLQQALERRGDGFRHRLLGPAERQELAARRLSGAREAEYLAGRWAAKEAVAKALGTGLAALGWRNIEIIGTRRGRPSCVLSAGAAQLAGQLGVVQVLVTITHEGGVAAACAVAMGDVPPPAQ